jgi:hypothetical protein
MVPDPAGAATKGRGSCDVSASPEQRLRIKVILSMNLNSVVEASAFRGREREPLDLARGPELVERASGFRLNCGI